MCKRIQYFSRSTKSTLKEVWRATGFSSPCSRECGQGNTNLNITCVNDTAGKV